MQLTNHDVARRVAIDVARKSLRPIHVVDARHDVNGSGGLSRPSCIFDASGWRNPLPRFLYWQLQKRLGWDTRVDNVARHGSSNIVRRVRHLVYVEVARHVETESGGLTRQS